jgi:hypothetical protein
MCKMNCEEFEAIGLDAERDAALSEAERAAAREHAGKCSRCAALEDSWQAARAELRVFAEATAAAETPARVEMRLRQEFRTQHRTVKARRAAVIAAWAMAAAALLFGAVGWWNWRLNQQQSPLAHRKTPQTAGILPGKNQNAGAGLPAAGSLFETPISNAAATGLLVADNEINDFTLLPGVLQTDLDDADIVRVRMQRGALGALGLPVNEERAGEWIQVDLLVGNDGLPQAVRLPQ